MTWRTTNSLVAGFAISALCTATAFAQIPPTAVDDAISVLLGNTATHNFVATDAEDDPTDLSWTNLLFILSPGAPAISPTLSSDGLFSWNTTGSELGRYKLAATVTDTDFLTDQAILTVDVVDEPINQPIPEPTSLIVWSLLVCVAMRARFRSS